MRLHEFVRENQDLNYKSQDDSGCMNADNSLRLDPEKIYRNEEHGD